jgi:hypothetical protein
MQHALEAAGIIFVPGNEQYPGSHMWSLSFAEAILILRRNCESGVTISG